MKMIHEITSNEVVIKNSRFICILFPLLDDKIDSYLQQVKEEYPKATHYCYAYQFDQVKHSSDDGEPGGTAGMPLLNVLEKEELNHTLVVVVRYFGGIKLGAGGLVRAYTKSLTETLKISLFDELEDGYQIQISFPYEEEKNVNYLLGNSLITKKDYLENITYTCFVNFDLYDKILPYHPLILEKCIIKKTP